MRRAAALLVAVVVTAVALVVGWRTIGPGGDASAPPTGTAPSPSESPAPTPTRATAPPAPPEGACYRLSYAEAVAPTASRPPVGCRSRHTAATFLVGRLDAVVAGHLVAVDSRQVRAQVARACPARFAAYVGGTREQRRLSVLRAVWFTPTLEEADEGADWFRCDVVAVARQDALAPFTGRLAGALDTARGRHRYGLCGTGEPGARRSQRVICSRPHGWRAVRTVGFAERAYPGRAAVRRAGERPCRRAGEQAAGGALDFRWGYEWPSAQQWRAGQAYGICWVPDRG